MTISIHSVNDEGDTIDMSTEEETWPEIADMFFSFMQARQFIVTERDMANYFSERADEMGNLRANMW